MENNKNFMQASKRIHSAKEKDLKDDNKNIDSTEQQRESTEEKGMKEYSYPKEGVKSHELKKYLELKKEITNAKKELLQKFLISGISGIIILISIIFLFFSLKKDKYQVKTPNNAVNMRILRQLQKNSNLLKEQLKIIAENQKILNQKIITFYETESQTIKKTNSDIKGIYNYLKTEGKIIEVVSQIIMNDDVKLNKIVEKIYQSNTLSQNTEKNDISKSKTPQTKTPDKIKKEIKKETDNLINKYKNLLKEIQ